MRLSLLRLLACGVASTVAWPASAWIWPEHRDIAAKALRDLQPAERATLDAMWADVRALGGKQLCPAVVDSGSEPSFKITSPDWQKVCIDLASFPALAGDHSCSSADLWVTVADADWSVKVVWVASRAKALLAEATTPAKHEDVWNLSHLAMQAFDPKYLTRAAGNNAHFLVPRAPVEAKETLDGYLTRAVSPETEINATGLYAEYHMLALRLAALYHSAPAAERPQLARRALLAEGVALHFLEDSFSSGHYAATWGGSAWQKGTHDLYSTIGLTTMTWSGELFASHGDASMTERDMSVAAVAIGRSLAQLANAAAGRLPLPGEPLTAADKTIEALDFCKASHLPPPPEDTYARSASEMVLQSSPVPAGGPDSIHPPRARADVGPFVGIVSGFSFGTALGGYDSWANARFREDFQIGARVGFGLEGLLTSSMDGQIWAGVSFVVDPDQLDLGCTTCPGGKRTNPAIPRVPSRSGVKFSLRMPYYVVPFDLILVVPTLMLVSPQSTQNVVFTAAYGGLLTSQRRWSTDVGTFQFMAGREVGFTLWGYSQADQFIVTPTTNIADSKISNYRSFEVDFPVAEWIPPRAFATTLSLAAVIQLGFQVEFPNQVSYTASGEPYNGLGPSWYIYLRALLDARKYFGGSSE
ncbi:MAG TPA: hypothetical protein VMT17_18175 [Anaeromyxobacteraceae bacterium]|nr:hypothetical protein [Anaeromyxobacteraceae bacterium]